MMKLAYTIWALLLNGLGISVFKTCFTDAVEDEYGDYLLSGPPITSFIFAMGVYTIINHLNFYPKTFRKPHIAFMVIYEFLVTAFLLEFAVACIWTPIDVHIYSTFSRVICKLFRSFGLDELSGWMIQNKFPMTLVCCATSFGFFLVALYITKSLDFSVYSECGTAYFADYVKNTIVQTVACELPRLERESHRKRSRCRRRRHC